jgi:hypothetical protein
MEALFNFCPEASTTLADENRTAFSPPVALNWWLKYSRVRDGGGLAQMLRQVRGSKYTIVAVETSSGHVLGSFTSSPWRLSSGWYGAGEINIDNAMCGERREGTGTEPDTTSFVWKMRHPRVLKSSSPMASQYAATAAAGSPRRSIVQQVYQESEIQVFPVRTNGSRSCAVNGDGSSSMAVQSCSLSDGIRLGQNELLPIVPTSPPQTDDNINSQAWDGEHYGHAVAIDPQLRAGSTSTSETFGNPCLVRGDRRGDTFDIVNLEVWTLTAHGTVEEAEHAELERLFLRTA